MYWMLWINEKVEGPFSPQEIQSLLNEGRITKSTLCRPNGEGGEWHPIMHRMPEMDAQIKPHAHANPKRETIYMGGSESGLAVLSTTLLLLGGIGAIILIFAGPLSHGEFSPADVALGVGLAVTGIAQYIVLQAGADVVRILKKSNGIPYSGDINVAHPTIKYQCPKCGGAMKSGKCDYCSFTSLSEGQTEF